MCRECSGAVIGGPTPFIATALVALADGRPTYVMVYLGFFCLLTAVSVGLGQHLSRHHETESISLPTNGKQASSI